MNIFEGARRITKLTAGLILIGFIIYGANDTPYITTTYNITFGDPPSQTTRGCPIDSKSEYINRTTTKKTKVYITLCFLAEDFPSSQRLIPYKYENGVWGDKWYTSNVKQYVDKVSDAFVIPEADEVNLDKQWRAKRISGLGAIFGSMLLSLTLLLVFAWTVGWIVRGFMGIPKGQDKKPDA